MDAQLRTARPEDTAQVFEWRNDPWIVSLSQHQRKVEWEEHLAYFNGVLQSPDHIFYIIENTEGDGIGVLHFSRERDQAQVSIYLMQSFTGSGLGVKLLRLGCQKAHLNWPNLVKFIAKIRSDNQASVRAFQKAGFRITSEDSDLILCERET